MTAESGEAGPGSSIATSPTTRRAADLAARQAGARVVQDFDTDLFRAVARGAGNVVCSPYSVAVALAMTRNGARAATADEMDRVLRAGSADELNAGLNALTQHIENLGSDRFWTRWPRAMAPACAKSTTSSTPSRPYDGGGLAMAVVVPDAGRLDEIVRGFDAEFWHGLMTELVPTGVALRQAKWSVRTLATQTRTPLFTGRVSDPSAAH